MIKVFNIVFIAVSSIIILNSCMSSKKAAKGKIAELENKLSVMKQNYNLEDEKFEARLSKIIGNVEKEKEIAPVIFATNRRGKNDEHLEVICEVNFATVEGIVDNFVVGEYKTVPTDLAIEVIVEAINSSLNNLKKESLNDVKISGTITGIADATPVNSISYNPNHCGRINRIFCYYVGRKASRHKNIENKGIALYENHHTHSYITINNNTITNNKQLAFLRAYNAFLLIYRNTELSKIKNREIDIIAVHENQEGGKYRSVVLKLLIENIFLEKHKDIQYVDANLKRIKCTI